MAQGLEEYPFSRLEDLAAYVQGVELNGRTYDETVGWLRSYLRSEVDGRSRERAARHALAHRRLDQRLERVPDSSWLRPGA